MILEGPFFHVVLMPVPAKHTQAHTHTCAHAAHMLTHARARTHTHTCSDPRKPLPTCYPHACSSKKHAGMHTHVHTQHTCMHTHARTCTLAMILEGPFFHVIPMPVPAKHTQAHTHTHADSAHICMHTHAQSSRAFVLLLPIAPSSVSFTTGPRPRHHSSARGFSHHTLPFSTMSHTTSR